MEMTLIISYSVMFLQNAYGNLVCRCGEKFGKHGRSYDGQCDTPCTATVSKGISGIIDRTCGGDGSQLIYDVSGKVMEYNKNLNRVHDHTHIAWYVV